MMPGYATRLIWNSVMSLSYMYSPVSYSVPMALVVKKSAMESPLML